MNVHYLKARIMRQKLTRKQQGIFYFITDSINLKGYPPSVREIADHFGFRSVNAVIGHLVALERKGRIERAPGLARAIRVILPTDAD